MHTQQTPMRPHPNGEYSRLEHSPGNASSHAITTSPAPGSAGESIRMNPRATRCEGAARNHSTRAPGKAMPSFPASGRLVCGLFTGP